MEATRQTGSRTARARREAAATIAGWACFVAGLAFGLIALAGPARPVAGDLGEPTVTGPAAGIAALIAATAFVLSTLLHRRHETAPMPPWQRTVSHVSAVALTLAFAAVTAMAVLTGGEILALGLQGLEVPAVGGALLTAIASSAGGWLAFQAGVELRTRDLATLLFASLTIGTVFAMITAADPRWWELHFSRLGAGSGAWAFNGTVIVAGLLVATIGSYIGRDLHRWLGDTRLRGIGAVVILFALTGLALAGVGLFPLSDGAVDDGALSGGRLAHSVAAFGTLGLFAVTAVVVTLVMPGPPRTMLLTTVGAGVAMIANLLLWRPGEVYGIAALEAIAVGIIFVWMTTLVRTLSAFAPDASRPSARPTLLLKA